MSIDLPWNVQVYADYATLSAAVADWVAAHLRTRPASAFVFAMGNSPQGAYAELARRASRGEVDFSRAHAIQLDEYLGLDPGDRRALYGWLARTCLEPLGIAPERSLRLRSDAPDPERACAEVEAQIAALGGIDVSILGLGPNGHLGFNEPGSPLDSRTRPVPLSAESLVSNAVYWGSVDDVPRGSLTLGLGTLREARHTVLVVDGARKMEILRRVLHGPVTTSVPATCLRTFPDVAVMVDRAAAGAA